MPASWMSLVTREAAAQGQWSATMLNKKIIINADSEAYRLETPRTVGFRVGMTSSGVIGRRLENLFEVPMETPRKIDELLRALDGHADDD